MCIPCFLLCSPFVSNAGFPVISPRSKCRTKCNIHLLAPLWLHTHLSDQIRYEYKLIKFEYSVLHNRKRKGRVGREHTWWVPITAKILQIENTALGGRGDGGSYRVAAAREKQRTSMEDLAERTTATPGKRRVRQHQYCITTSTNEDEHVLLNRSRHKRPPPSSLPWPEVHT